MASGAYGEACRNFRGPEGLEEGFSEGTRRCRPLQSTQGTGNLRCRHDLTTLKFFQDAHYKQVLVTGHLHAGTLGVDDETQPGVDLSK